MSRAKDEIELARLARLKDRKSANRTQFEDIQREAAGVMARLHALDHVAYNVTRLATLWGTSSWRHVREMIDRAEGR